MNPPDSVRPWFVDAGWKPGRAVYVPDGIPPHHPATGILASFGELVLLDRNSEDDDPGERLVFEGRCTHPLEADRWSRLVGSELIEIGSEDNDHGRLYVDAQGRCFGSSKVHDAFYFYGQSFDSALEAILLRTHRALPMLRPGQEFVYLYGERFTAESPELFRYEVTL